jgi:hypothetical protein
MNNYLILSLLIGIAVLAVLFAVIFIYRNKGQKIEPDYRVFFILGVTWLPLGIATDNPGFLGMGAVFMAIGLANRGKWKEEPKWSELSPEKRRTKLLIIGGLTVLLLAGILFFIFAKSN